MYLVCAVAPRAMVFAHHHHGDEHDHVHAWGADVPAHDHGHDEEEHLFPAVAHGRPVLDADDHPHPPDHVHTQAPYPLAAPAFVPSLLTTWRVAAIVLAAAAFRVSRRNIPPTARGPPFGAV